MNGKFRPTKDYAKETGLVIVLVLLLFAYWTKNEFLLPVAIGTLLVVMTVPVLLKPLAVVWHYFSMLLGKVTNRLLLAAIFIGVLTPVGVLRGYLGFDPMKQKRWKKGTGTVFTVRDHKFTPDDFNTPY